MKFLLYLSRVGDVNYIIEDIIADSFLDDLNGCSNDHTILFGLLFPYCCWGCCSDGSGTCLHKVPNVFFDKYGLGEVWPLQSIVESIRFLHH